MKKLVVLTLMLLAAPLSGQVCNNCSMGSGMTASVAVPFGPMSGTSTFGFSGTVERSGNQTIGAAGLNARFYGLTYSVCNAGPSGNSTYKSCANIRNINCPNESYQGNLYAYMVTSDPNANGFGYGASSWKVRNCANEGGGPLW